MLDLAFTALLDFLAKVRGKRSEKEETACEEFVPYQPTGEISSQKRNATGGTEPVTDESRGRSALK